MRSEANPVKTQKITPPRHWDPQQAREADMCCRECSRLGISGADIAVLMHGEEVVHLECVRPGTVELFQKFVSDRTNLWLAKDRNDEKLYQMMIDESYMLFIHALNKDLAAWNQSRLVS
jgi:hypothetical protein